MPVLFWSVGLGIAILAVFLASMYTLLHRQMEDMRLALAHLAAHSAVGESAGGHQATTVHAGEDLTPLRDLIWDLDARGVEGDWLEVGAGKGGITAYAATALQASPSSLPGPRRGLTLCDQQWPSPPPLVSLYAAAAWAIPVYLTGRAQVEVPEFYKGQRKIAVAWVDFSLSEDDDSVYVEGETRTMCEALKDLMAPGGVILVPGLDYRALLGAFEVLGKADGFVGREPDQDTQTRPLAYAWHITTPTE